MTRARAVGLAPGFAELEALHQRLTAHRARTALCTLAALGLSLVVGGCPPPRPAPAAPTSRAIVGETPPAIDETYITGRGPQTLAEARGKVVVLDFWATFCDPCRRSFPAYEELQRQRDVAVIAVSLDDPADQDANAIEQFAKETGATFTILWDEDQSTISTYDVRKMPTAYLIDKRGVVRHVHGGYEAATLGEIQRQINALLDEP